MEAIPRTLVMTGHFPPEPGGVETFAWELARRLPAEALTVIGPHQTGAREFDAGLDFPVIRRRGYLLFRDLKHIVADCGARTAWIPAAAPFGLYAPALRRAGIERVLASSHGQELGWLRVAPTREAVRRMARSLDVLTYLSAYTRTHLEPVVERPQILHQLAGGVDVDLFRPGPCVPGGAAREGPPVVMSVARLVRRKGHDVLLRAWPQVLRLVPDARLVIVGVGPMRGRLESAAAEPAMRRSVTITGFLPAPELVARLQAADVFVAPCRDDRAGLQTEGLGLAVLEASAAGLPTVVGRSGGSVDSVLDGETGLLVDAAEPGPVADALVELLLAPQRAREMGLAGARWVRENWTWPGSAATLAALLRG
jgi:phosphatidylinositol alpha-1,6-mannosyltransferase